MNFNSLKNQYELRKFFNVQIVPVPFEELPVELPPTAPLKDSSWQHTTCPK